MNYCNCPNCATDNCPAGIDEEAALARIRDLLEGLEAANKRWTDAQAKLALYEQAARELPEERWVTLSHEQENLLVIERDDYDALRAYATTLTVENKKLDDQLAGELPTSSELAAIRRFEKAEAELAELKARVK